MNSKLKGKSNQTIYGQLVRLLFLFAFVPLLFVSAINYYRAAAEVEQFIKEDMVSSTLSKKGFVEQWFSQRVSELNLLGRSNGAKALLKELGDSVNDFSSTEAFLSSGLWVDLNSRFGREIAQFSLSYDHVYDVYLIDNRGNILFSLAKEADFGTNLISGPFKDSRFAGAVRRSLNQPGVHFSDLDEHAASKGLVTGFLTRSISDDRMNPLGVLAIQLRWESFVEMLSGNPAYNQQGLRFSLLDRAYEQKLFTMKASQGNVLPSTIRQQMIANQLAAEQLTSEYIFVDDKGVERAGQLTPVFAVDKTWYLYGEITRSEALQAVNALWSYLIGSLLVTAGLVLFLAKRFSNKLTNPLTRAVEYSKQVAAGGLKEGLHLRGTEEIAALSDALNDMLASLQDNKIELIASKQEQEASYSEANELRNATDQHCIVTVTDLNGKIEYANDKFCEISEYSRDELIGKSHRLINSGHHPKKFFAQMFETLQRGETWQGSICNRSKSGALFWLDTSVIPFRNPDKTIVKYVAIRTDITNHKLSVSALEKNKQQLQLLVSSTGVGMWDWNLETENIVFNEPWAKLVGASTAELQPLTKNTWFNLVHPDDLGKLNDDLAKLFQGEVKQIELECRLKHKDKGWIWVLESAKVVEQDVDGRAKRLIGTTLDISKQKQTTLQLNQSRDQFQSLVDNIPGISYRCMLDANWTMLFISHQVKRVLDFEPEEIIGNKTVAYGNLILPEFREYVENEVLDAVYKNKSWTIEYQVKNRQGETRWVYEKGQAVKNKQGDIEYLDGFILDISDRKQQQQEILKLSRVAAQTNNAVLMTDKTGVTEWVNKAFTDISGYELPELVGKKPGRILQGELTDNSSIERMSKSIAAVEPFQETLINYHKDGTPYWIEIRCNPIYDESGNHQGFIAIESDVSEQKQTSEALELQKRLLENMSRLGRIGAWQVDLVSGTIYWSSMTKEIHEVDENFVPELDTAINFYKEGYSRDRINELVARAMEHGTPWNEELQLVTAKGNEIWVVAYGEVQKEGDQVVRLFGSFQDIHQQKLAMIEEQRVATLHKTLAQINEEPSVLKGNLSVARDVITSRVAKEMNVERCAIWHFDSAKDEIRCVQFYDNGTFHSGLTLNRKEHPAYFKMLEGEPMVCEADVLNSHKLKPFTEYFAQFNICSVLNHVFQLGDGDMGILVTEHTGQPREWSETEQQFIVSMGIILGGVFLSEQRRLTREKLIIAKEQAEKAAKVKSEFLATMSHEIRTPMNGVLGMLELLEADDLSIEQQRKTKIAISSANALLTIINEILDFSRLDSGKVELEQIEFDVRELIENTLNSVALLAQEKGLELVADINLPDEIVVKGDPARIRQIITNLLGNAVKFTNQGDVILSALGIETEEGYKLHITVNDTGVGIPKGKQKSLFEPFTQVDASTTRRFGGSGLGLAICHKLVKAMNGDISVESDEDQGSSFSVTLPLGLVKQFTETQYPDLNANNIVVIDGNHQSVLAIKACLNTVPVSHRCFSSVEKFVTNMDDIPKPDMVMISRAMVEGADESIVGKIKGRWPDCDLVLMTELTDKSNMSRLLGQGFCGFINKPILKHEMIEKLCLNDVSQVNVSDTKTETDVELPAKESEPLSENNTAVLSGRILLVEDNKVNQQVAAMMLTKLGFEYQLAENGIEALASLTGAQQPFDLILMDCQMPEMDGYEATKQIRAGAAGDQVVNIPIVALTANAMEGDAEKCFRAGMNAYLSKPVQALPLKESIERLL